jgi:hypothetical protein
MIKQQVSIWEYGERGNTKKESNGYVVFIWDIQKSAPFEPYQPYRVEFCTELTSTRATHAMLSFASIV